MAVWARMLSVVPLVVDPATQNPVVTRVLDWAVGLVLSGVVSIIILKVRVADILDAIKSLKKAEAHFQGEIARIETDRRDCMLDCQRSFVYREEYVRLVASQTQHETRVMEQLLAMRDRIGDGLDEIRKERAEQHDDLHNRITKLVGAVAELSGELRAKAGSEKTHE